MRPRMTKRMRVGCVLGLIGASAVWAIPGTEAQSVAEPASGRPAGEVRAGSSVALSLDDAIKRALDTHETVAQAGEAIRSAEAGLMEARAGRWPHLDVGGEYAHNIKKPSFFLPAEFGTSLGGAAKVEMGGDYDVTGAVTATWSLWTAGRLSAAMGAAREWVATAQCREAATRDYVRFQVRSAYCAALLAVENLSIAERAVSETEEAARVARAGFDAGTVSRFDLQRAEVELANRRAPLVEAKNAVDQAFLSLGRLCGLAPGAAPTLTDTLAPVVHPRPVEELLDLMRDHSPELLALDHAVASARQRVDLQRAQRWPLMQLSGQYVLQGEWDDDPLPEEDNLATSANVALGVSIPIFDGFETKGRIESARADLRAAQLELSRVSRDKELAVRQALLHLENALVALEGREEVVALAEEAHRLALVRLENGLATPLERLDAESAMTTARAQLAAALYAANIAEATLQLTIGAPLSGTMADPSGRTHHE